MKKKLKCVGLTFRTRFPLPPSRVWHRIVRGMRATIELITTEEASEEGKGRDEL